MKKTLPSNSILHFLPEQLGTEKLMILDSIRFTLEMIDYSSNELNNCLTNITTGNENKIHHKVFHYAWSMEDHSHRFVKLYKALNPPKDSIIHQLDYLTKFRNAIQHIDVNLTGKNVNIIENGRPIYGAIKWIVHNKKETYTSLLISGIFNIKNIEFKHRADETFPELINCISLETDTLKKKHDNEINLSILIETIAEIVFKLDESLNNHCTVEELPLKNWKSEKDVLLNMKHAK